LKSLSPSEPMKKSSAKSKAVKETRPTFDETGSEPNNPPVEAQPADSPVPDENAKQVASETDTVAEDLPPSPPTAEAPHFSEPKGAEVQISKHERRTANAALKIAKLEKIPARGSLKAKDIAALPEVSEEALVDFVLHCRSMARLAQIFLNCPGRKRPRSPKTERKPLVVAAEPTLSLGFYLGYPPLTVRNYQFRTYHGSCKDNRCWWVLTL
jgi:hypothetical protein